MKRTLLLSLLVLCGLCCMAYEVQYEKADSLKVMRLLQGAKGKKGTSACIIHLARQLKGIPYVAHTLEVNKTEKLVVNLRQLDCTTYVETVTALYLCVKQGRLTFKAFCDNLLKIRYRGGGKPHYLSRLHYFTDWIDDNTKQGVCREIQSPTSLFSAMQRINVYYMSQNPGKYKALRDNPKYVGTISEQERRLNAKSYRYIPEARLANSAELRAAVKDGDIIATTTRLKGLDIQHIGFAVWHDDGLHMLNASSLRHKVVEEPQTLYRYLLKQKSMTGIRVVRLN